VTGHTFADERSLTSRLRRAWTTFRNVPLAPTAIIALFVIFAVLAPLLSPYDPTQIQLTQKLKPPLLFAGGSAAHLLGTDNLGRDVLSRVIWGARVSLGVTAAVVVLSSIVGLLIGLAAGYVGGRTDDFLMRLADGSIAFPAILIALLFAVSLGPGVTTVILALSVLSWANYSRIVRGEVLHLRQSEFIVGARVIGCSPVRVMATHLFPNLLDVWVVMITLQVGLIVLSEAALGFLGAGVPPPTPSWGSLVSDGRNYVDTAWWISFFPGLAIGLLVLSVNYLGDWLRDRMDPRLRHR
ncbi:MAG: ABC transporter permease, partial [Chloroflexi bacterium]|nr:ABC transporter permease [Chloroflexota bacterium]